MAIFSSKTKPCYDYDPNLRVKKELEKLEVELEEVGIGRYRFRKRLYSVLLTSTMVLAAIIVRSKWYKNDPHI